MVIKYKLIKEDPRSMARLGQITTPHSVIDTPCFMPVGTQATVKALSKEEIEKLARKHAEHPELREAHKALAREIITFLHGEEEYEKAVNLANHLFNNKFNDLSKSDIEDLFKGQEIKSIEPNVNMVEFVVNMGIAKSKREAREFIEAGAISINGEKVTDIGKIIDESNFIEKTYIVVKRGKKNYYIGKIK